MSQPTPKRILRIAAQLNISGPALQALLLTAELEEMGYETYLIGGIRDEDDSMRYIAEQHGIDITIMPSFIYDNPLQTIPAVIDLYRLIKEIQPDVVHTHNPRAGFVGRIAARLANVPVVVHTLHEYPFRGYYNRLSTQVFIMMERVGANLSDSIITLSQGLRHALADKYNITRKSRITVLPVGYDLKIFADTKRHTGQFRAAWHIPEDAPLIGIIGRLMPVKNHRLFLEAATQIRQAMPNARFVIVGDGEERQALEGYAQSLGLGELVIFTGWQQHIERIYSDLDVLVISSFNEGTPVPIIEALSGKCPVVSTDVGGVADLLDNGNLGALVPSGNATALAEAIVDTIHNPPDMSLAQATMLRRYDITRLAKDLDSLYRGLFAKKSSA